MKEVVRLRSNFRTGEDGYLFDTHAGPELKQKALIDSAAAADYVAGFFATDSRDCAGFR